MKTKWGSCNPNASDHPTQYRSGQKTPRMPRIHSRPRNGPPARANPQHRFVALMDRFLPKWRLRRETLNSLPVRHETWDIRPRDPFPLGGNTIAHPIPRASWRRRSPFPRGSASVPPVQGAAAASLNSQPDQRGLVWRKIYFLTRHNGRRSCFLSTAPISPVTEIIHLF